jgi:adenosylhomocysteine nucleosidase
MDIGKQKRVALVCATSAEYLHCRDQLNPGTEMRLRGRPVSTWSDEGLVASMIHAGPGKIQCASATQLLIDEFSPDLVIDAGAAGSLDPSNEIGCVVCAQNCFEYDICPIDQFTRLSQDLTTVTLAANPDHRIDRILAEFSRCVVSAGLVPSFRIGNIVSGEKNVADAATRERLRTAFNAFACNWETAAVLKTAALNGIGSLSFRVITDSADENALNDYKDNLNRSLTILAACMRALICDGWGHRIITAKNDPGPC